MKANEVTAYLGISISTLQRYMKHGKIAYRRSVVNDRISFDQSEVERFKKLLDGDIVVVNAMPATAAAATSKPAVKAKPERKTRTKKVSTADSGAVEIDINNMPGFVDAQ